MESFLVHLMHAAAWTSIVIVILAIIGLIAIIRWFIGLFRRGEAAVHSGVDSVEGTFRR
jgi:hypothetical protein